MPADQEHAAADAGPRRGPSPEESLLIGELHFRANQRRDGWVYATLDALLLDKGRLFRPSPWPDGGDPPGEPGRCFVESVSWAWAAAAGDLAYVEGYALAPGDVFAEPHAWCAAVDGAARDVTWRRPGTAYLGLPVRAEVAKDLMAEQFGPLLHGAEGLISPLAERWMRTGVPEDLLVPVGRPVPGMEAAA
ncbi:hypothetical protein ACFTZI_32460 [Streptomyces decoyicus]|uniref:hypothetical protein n=1 Tax=Streptomyces decoyicus TaxID=249567 RepID=UPI003639BCB1